MTKPTGNAIVWFAANFCSIDIYMTAESQQYIRYVPTDCEGMPEPGSGKSGGHFEKVWCNNFDSELALKYIKNPNADHKNAHKGTKLIFGKLNENGFSRIARVVETGYRWFLDENPDWKPHTPYLKWAAADLGFLARGLTVAAGNNLSAMSKEQLAFRQGMIDRAVERLQNPGKQPQASASQPLFSKPSPSKSLVEMTNPLFGL